MLTAGAKPLVITEYPSHLHNGEKLHTALNHTGTTTSLAYPRIATTGTTIEIPSAVGERLFKQEIPTMTTLKGWITTFFLVATLMASTAHASGGVIIGGLSDNPCTTTTTKQSKVDYGVIIGGLVGVIIGGLFGGGVIIGGAAELPPTTNCGVIIGG